MAETVVLEQDVHSMSRQSQLLEIMKDAAKHVLQRDALRRGPYVIADKDLQSVSETKR